VPEAGARQLMISLWYPARTTGGAHARYMTPQESALVLKGEGISGVPSDVLSTTRTDAFPDAPPLGRKHGLPLVVLSPGFSLPRSSLTALGEDLASKGYIVAAVDHTYESFGITFPDGSTTTCLLCERQQTPELGEEVATNRAADISFVLDRLIGPRPAWNGSSLIDPSRIGMAGHSIGGNSVATTMLADSRVQAGVNMDGTLNAPIPATGLSRPFLLLGTEQNHTPGSTADTTWKRDWPHLTGWRRWLTVAGGEHSSFTDYSLLAEQLGLGHAVLSGARSIQITRTYVAAFFDRRLHHRPQPLLNGPSKRYPEVRFWD
jgi:dienelactone hydrolase